jgi:peptide/nickel transport system ATP-binding protein
MGVSDVNLLELRNVSKTFVSGFLFFRRKVVAVDKVSFSIPGEKPTAFVLAGESGSGKSTIARIILRFIKPDEGEVLYRGRNILASNSKELLLYRREVQAVFQDPYSAFNPVYSVDHILSITARRMGVAQGKEVDEVVDEALVSVGLRPEEVRGKYPYQLSGGQRQRVLLARALIPRPKLIVADEPVSMLDASLRAEILNLMLDLKAKHGVSFLYITHDLSTASYVGDYIAVLYKGSLVEMGPIDDVISSPYHPYTQLLMSSIPVPDPSRRWQERMAAPEVSAARGPVSGCKFYDRCPLRKEECRGAPPTLKKIGNRYVACYLY